MEFSRKARIFANRAMADAPSSLTYYSVVSSDSGSVGLFIAELNDLDIMAWDVGDSYLNEPCQENIWFAAGPEHGPGETGNVVVVIRDLYGLNSSGASWRKMFAETLIHMEFVPTVADPNVYHIQAMTPNGEDYYELMVVYVDDVICCWHNPQLIMDALALKYDLKYKLVGPPKIYFGAEINKYQVRIGKSHCIMSSTQYVKNAIKMVG